MKKTGLWSIIIAALVGFLVGHYTTQNIANTKKGDPLIGENLEKKIWADMKDKNEAAVADQMADGFQSLHQDGARDKAGELELIKKLNLSSYTLNDIKVTINGNAMIVSYKITTDETIDRARIQAKDAPRLSVWQKTPTGWKWIAHTNISPIKK